jgi:hypothetical protein
MKEFESLGLWWIPSNPDHELAGNIKFSHEAGISLEIIGNFSDPENSLLIKNQLEIIIGVTHGKLFTLINCDLQHSSQSFPGIETQEYGVKIALSGYHFNNLEEIKFDKVKVDFSYLKYLSIFKFSWKVNNDINSKKELTENTLHLCTLNDIRVIITKCEIFIKQLITRNSQPQKMSIDKSTFIEICLHDKESLDTIYKKFLNPLKSFITLASNKPNYITSLFFDLQIDGEIKRIEAIFQESIFMNTTDTFNKKDVLFELSDIKQDLSLILQLWFNFYEGAEDIMNLYFSSIYNTKLYIENTFLSRVQALESYHRRIIDKKNSYTEEHQERLESILEKTPPEYKDWLRGQLNFSHEPSLEQRLKELFQLTNKTVSPLVSNSDRFIRKVKKIRNYLTHYNNPDDSELLEGEKLFRINQILGFMMQSCLLQELGCSDERCEELIGRIQEYQYLKKLDINF